MEGIRLAGETTVMDLGALLDACDDAMVTLVAGDTRLVAHRAVLSDRSPVFGAMFRHDMLEASSGEVTIPDVEGPALRQLLASLYTLQGPQLPGMAAQLLVAADKYGVSVLKAKCEQQLAAQLSVETAADTVFLAIRHSCPSLRQAAIAYIKTHQVEVMATQGWTDAVHLQPEDVDEVRKLLSETSSPTPADSSQPLGHTASTAAPLPQPPPASLPRLMATQSLACDVLSLHLHILHIFKSSTMEALEHAQETTVVNLGDILDACDDAVVTLVAGETRLVAHRAVLVHRSPVFASIFRDDTLESRSGQVTIVDVEGPVLRQLVSYLYTLRAPQLIDIDAVTQLLAAAHKYGVASLKAAWEQQVAAQLSVETAAAAAVLAVRHNCESLRRASISFLMEYTRKVMATRGWADAIGSQPDDLMEVNRLLVAEMRSLPAEERSKRLIQAAQQGAVGELEALLAAGADVAARQEYGLRWTALHWAAAGGHVEAARRLVAWEAPVDARGCMQRTPLHAAAESGHAAVVRQLLAASADHSARDWLGCTPLHYAAVHGHREAAAALLEAGADRAARDDMGRTPLDLARRGNHQQLVELLTRN